MNYSKHVSTKETPQSHPIPGSSQVANSAGGYSWAVDDWARLDRFLILGTEGGSYYASERKLTVESAEAVKRCLAADGLRVVRRIVEVSDAGRAPKNDPAIFALAMAAKTGNDATRRAAFGALNHVCRIGTHLMHFAEYVQAFGGWGRGTRRAVAKWYSDRPVGGLALQLVKYQSRDGWASRDLLRLAHPKTTDPARDWLFRWATKGLQHGDKVYDEARIIIGFEKAKSEKDPNAVARIVDEYRLPRECVPTASLNHAVVWEALLPHMGLTALVRNLATMTRVGILAPMSRHLVDVTGRLHDRETIKASRMHPIAFLSALLTYQQGHGVRGSHTWTPQPVIVDALNDAFYLAFGNVEPTGKRTLLALDVSASMGSGTIAGVPGLTPRVGTAAMALVTAAVEQRHHCVGFTSGPYRTMHPGYSAGLTELSISPKQRLDDVVRYMSALPFGGTDCALPMVWAMGHKVEVDTFVIYTDNETWAGNVHPAQALNAYRRTMGIPAKLVVVGMVANDFTIADPNDSGMMDVVGFDTAAPSLIADFSRGR